MKKLVVFTGAGISEESGIQTYRDTNGLWYNHDIEKVATYEGWLNDPRYVLEFYNEMRSKLKDIEPNKAHVTLVELEKTYDINIITQNVDDLHERAGSTNIIHLHGELTKARGCGGYDNIMDIGYNRIEFGEHDEQNNQIRPHIVWFGEPVLNLSRALEITQEADIFVVIGSSLLVYPASSLIFKTKQNCKKFIIDPKFDEIKGLDNTIYIKEPATLGVQKLMEMIR